MCASNSRRASATSLSRFTTTVVPSSSTALYDVPTLPLPSTSADARSRSSRSKLYPAPFPTNTSRLCSPAPAPAPAAAAAADPVAPPPRSSLDEDVMPPPSPDAVGPNPVAGAAAEVTAFGPSLAALRRWDFAQSTMTTRRRSAATTAPTTMPAIAAPESFRFLEEPGTGPPPGLSPGAGDGGKNGLPQGGSGSPQSWRLPAKESRGKCESVLGIEPLRLLSETLKTASPGMLMLGMLPERWLPSSRSTRSAVRLLSAKGMGPDRLLCASTRRSSPLSLATPAGMAPESRFCCRNRALRLGSWSRSSGMLPRRRLERSESTRRLGSRPSVPGGMAPMMPTPGRRTLTTVELAASHVTPTQPHAGVDVFHPRRRSCGVAVRNASSADRSLGGGSATAQHAKEAIANRAVSAAATGGRGPAIAMGRGAGDVVTGEALGEEEGGACVCRERSGTGTVMS
uniref:Uncharacterized protein n=1 Tax=Arundo donax TaxID=35708 RepID=A0A0A9BEM1_ARUDO